MRPAGGERQGTLKDVTRAPMVRRFRFAPLLMLALAACGGESVPAADSAPTAPRPGGLSLTSDGVAGLSRATRFDSASVHAALPPGFTTERHDAPDGARTVWALRDGQIVFEVSGDTSGTVARIDAPNEDVSGPGGVHPGQTFAEAGAADLTCTIGADDLRDRAVCRGAGVDLVFASQALVGQSALPPTDSLANAFLERLVWRAEG